MTSGSTLLAHGVGSKQDLPIPFSFVVVGAAVALVVSFLALLFLWREPRLDPVHAGRRVPTNLARGVDSRVTRSALRLLGMVVTSYVVLAAVFGKDDALNPTPTVVYVLFWVGIPLLSLLVGPVWRLVNPIRTLHLLLSRAMGTAPEHGLAPLPRWVGYWPAAVSLFAFVWMELIAPDRATLPVLRLFFAIYLAVHLLAATYFGSGWFERGDGFEVFSSLLGRLSVLGRADGAVVLRSRSTARQVSPGHRGCSGSWGCCSGRRCSTRCPVRSPVELDAQFAHSLVPIVAGYFVAHYWSLLVIVGQQSAILLSDPLGTGADWLGTGGRGIDSTLAGPTTTAVIQVCAVVLGHVLGVVLAHDRAVALLPRRHAIRGQIPLLVLMIGYTVGGLVLLFAS